MDEFYGARIRNAACLEALGNLRDCILPDQRFPMNVFRDSWNSFYFFDSDSIFDAEFVKTMNSLLEVEAGVCACIVNLDEASLENRNSAFFINRDVTIEEYGSFLRSGKIGQGWIYGMDRFAGISNLGHWCMYCEKGNEIAVIALRDRGSLQKLTEIVTQLGGLPIGQAISVPPSYGLSPRALSSDWRQQLLTQY